MAKVLMCLSLAAYCSAAFAQTEYAVAFSTDRTDIAKVYLCSKENGTVIDSAACIQGKAAMKGQKQLPMVASLSLTADGKRELLPFILDDTPITVTQSGEEMDVEGSLTNLKYTALRKRLESGHAQFQIYQKEYTGYRGRMPDSLRLHLQKELRDTFLRMYKEVKNALDENGDNLIPACLIASYSDMIGIEETTNYLKGYAFRDNGILRRVNNTILAYNRKTEGAPFADFTMNDIEGVERKLSDYVGKGNYVLVDFWASWCGPCRAEMPHVKAAYEGYHTKGFEVVGVSLDSEKSAWVKAVKQLGITWPQLSDLNGWNNMAALLYGVRSIPASILYDPEGKVVAVDLRGDKLTGKLAELYP